ncbi:hypothetical protein [Arenimonas alkanexedens]
MSEHTQDWSALAADWQQQETPAIDIEAIREEAEQRSRGLRRTIRMEIGFALLVIVVCALIAMSPRSDRVETLMFAGLAAFLTVYQGLMVWIRRRDLAQAGNGALALVERELQRASTVLRYWRWGMWCSLALWAGIYALMLYGMAAGWPSARISGILGATTVNIVFLPAMGLFGWWRCSQARARQVRFRALREQLRGP